MKKTLFTLVFSVLSLATTAQTFTTFTSTEGNVWKQSTAKMQQTAATSPVITIDSDKPLTTFHRWGTCFNELGWDALNMLPAEKQAEIIRAIFAPDGDLRISMGRIPMNANDYARSWYSCDEVAGDFKLKYFNIERDKQTLIPYIKRALEVNPNMTFWSSPWCPPSWMKVNADYPVRSDKSNQMDARKDYILLEGADSEPNDYKAPKGIFPQKLAVTDYLIQDARYLQTYANYFGRFIDAYNAEGIRIGMVMYQNEAWSYTPYPGCAWTPKGIIRFNTEYLAPTLKRTHPDVEIYLGTINTNRYDFIDEVLSDPRMSQSVKGIGVQWEGGQILSRLREKFPNYRYVQTESECGWGSFDWAAGEHTFERIAHYLGNGCEDYTFWNAILADEGFSTWQWKQNALIRVDSKTKIATFTPEYYAVKHFTHFIANGTKILAHKSAADGNTPILVAHTTSGKLLIMAGNLSQAVCQRTIKIGKKYVNLKMQPHSLQTLVEK